MRSKLNLLSIIRGCLNFLYFFSVFLLLKTLYNLRFSISENDKCWEIVNLSYKNLYFSVCFIEN